MLGTFVALDLLLFFVFFEVVLVPMWFVIASWGDDKVPGGRLRAANKFILYTLLGSAVMLLGFLLVGAADRHLRHGRARRPGPARACATAPRCSRSWRWRSASRSRRRCGRCTSWLPDAHTAAPTVGSVLLAGVLLKMGTYGFVRIALPVVPGGRRAGRAVPRRARRRRHPLRLARLPRAARPQAADRLLQRRAHGLRAARHRDADAGRHQRRAVRQHRPRPDHRPAVLPGRRDQGPARTPPTSTCSAAGSTRGCPGSAGCSRSPRRQPRAARAGRVLGRDAGAARRVRPGAGAAARLLPAC